VERKEAAVITVTIRADSITPSGNRLTTWELTYPRFVHSEVMTHRGASRNASSSRAIPISKMLAMVRSNPAMPEFWGKNQSGMQALEQLPEPLRKHCRAVWAEAADDACLAVSYTQAKLDLHKQLANRLLEPFAHITVVFTMAEACARNFFALRAHPDAQPEFQVLAYRMLKSWLNHEPKLLEWNEWHLPFSDDLAFSPGMIDLVLKICTGRLARVSYLTHDGIRDPDEDIKLHERLASSGHWSPFEHCAQATADNVPTSNFGQNWHQYRKQFSTELRQPTNEELEKALEERPNWFKL
jgi:thymidylate synthase ThyX